MDNKTERILNTLTQIASELQSVVESRAVNNKKLVRREWSCYQDALDKVEQAVFILNQLDISTTAVDPPITSRPKKKLLARLQEIEIEGEPDWSERHGEIL